MASAVENSLKWYSTITNGRFTRYRNWQITDTRFVGILAQPLNASGIPYSDNRGMVSCESVAEAIKVIDSRQ